jgi:hypothetical protein
MADPDTAINTTSQLRVCITCGGSLAGHRKDARCCSASCRVEASRFRAILNGTDAGPYRSIVERLSKLRSSQTLVIPQGKTEKSLEGVQEPAHDLSESGSARRFEELQG